MGLKETIAKSVQGAIKTMGNLRSFVSYVQSTPGAYSPSTDTLAVTSKTYTNVPCLLVKLSTEDLDWWPGDMKGQKMLLAANDLPGVIPDDTDYVIIDSVVWNIFKIRRVPGDSLFVIFLREP